MWPQNLLTERLGLKWPIFQAPMGGYTTPMLAAAVCNAGGLGGLGMWGFSAEDAERRIAGFRQQSGGSLNVNYPLWEDPGDLSNTGHPMLEQLQSIYDAAHLGALPNPVASAGVVGSDHLAMLQDVKPEVVSFHFGLPSPETLKAIKSAGIFVISSATTVAEAEFLEANGIDAIIAQGIEAGGHRGTFSGVDAGRQPGLIALLRQVVDAVRVPVIAAGGIADGRAIAAAFMLGASAVQLGTAFLRCEEADVPDTTRASLVATTASSTVVTNVLSGRPARAIKNQLVDKLLTSRAEPLPFPAQLDLTDPLEASGHSELAPIFAGQSAALSRDLPAGTLVERLAEETSRRIAMFR